MGQYLPIVCLLVLAVLFGVLSVLASKLLAPRRPSAAKDAPYECGIVPARENPERFPVSFYVVAMLFVMFDIELIFLYPFAVDRQFLGSYALWEMLAFSLVFFLAFVYVVARGALDWGPLHRQRRTDLGDEVISVQRTSTSTIRRVGTEGRFEESSAA